MNDFKKEYRFHKKTVDPAIGEVLRSGWYILGKRCEQFEQEFAAYVGTPYCVGVANGLEALQIALMALGVGKGDEVITVSNSAVATALAITNAGATPVFVDIDEYYHMDVHKIEQAITSKTKAILPVHLFGQLANIGEICAIARRHGLKVVEDACQAHGAESAGRKAGAFGDIGCFSFYPTKNLGAYGDGGAITTHSREIYEQCKKLRNYGQSSRYLHDIKGVNSRLDELQAAVLSEKLKMLPLLIKRRNKNAELYLRELKNIPALALPKKRKDSTHAFHLFVIQTERRDELHTYLKNQGIETQIHYPVPIHKQRCYAEFNSLSLPVMEDTAKKILSLPIHPFLTEEEVIEVCKAIKQFFNQKS